MKKLFIPGVDLGATDVKIIDPNGAQGTTGSRLITNLNDPAATTGDAGNNNTSGLKFDAQGRPLDAQGNIIPPSALNTIFTAAALPTDQPKRPDEPSTLDTIVVGGKQLILKIKVITETTVQGLIDLGKNK